MQATSAPTVTSPRRRGRRKTVFINPGFQWRYAALVAGGVFVVALLMCTVMYGVLYDQARARLLYLAPAHALENTVSLVLFAGVPTGVAVAGSQQHGGPFPSSTQPSSTSVGYAALDRFLRPVALQDAPAWLTRRAGVPV